MQRSKEKLLRLFSFASLREKYKLNKTLNQL